MLRLKDTCAVFINLALIATVAHNYHLCTKSVGKYAANGSGRPRKEPQYPRLRAALY